MAPTIAHLLRDFPLVWIGEDGAVNEALLWRVGLPVDLLHCFRPPDASGDDPFELVRSLGRFMKGDPSPDALTAYVESVRFAFRPTVVNFEIMPENGHATVARLRMQLPRPDVLLGDGDGTAADMFRQLATRLADVEFLISIEEEFVGALRETIGRWAVPDPARITVVAEPLQSTQWAQDNCKTGLALIPPRIRPETVTLIPRYASQGEWATTFMPSESYVFDSLAAAGIHIAQSPLLFQGGNLLPVENPTTNRRLLLVGEAEILRNRMLGLSPEQVEEAFRREFGVDRCIVLPAVSFHVDLELSVRTCRGDLVAFVNDSEAACGHVLQLGIVTLQDARLLDERQASELSRRLDIRDYRRLVPPLWDALGKIRLDTGELPEDFAARFVRSAAELPADNVKRFLLALDILTAIGLTQEDLDRGSLPEDRRQYYRLIRQRESDRRELHDRLRELGFRVQPVPSLSDEEVSINYINGVHGRGWFLMPTLGGYFTPLDEAARAVYARTFDADVRIIPILSALSQRRYGGIHCSVSVYASSE